MTRLTQPNTFIRMEGILKRKLNKWLTKAVEKVKTDGFTQDIHLDEIITDEYRHLTKAEILQISYQIFTYLIDYITKKKIDTSDINIYLSIDLESESNVFQGLPKSLTEIESSIDAHSIPEIILYHDPNPNYIPLTELYRVPVLFEPSPEIKNITMFYKEYRLMEENVANSDYIRELNIIYNQ